MKITTIKILLLLTVTININYLYCMNSQEMQKSVDVGAKKLRKFTLNRQKISIINHINTSQDIKSRITNYIKTSSNIAGFSENSIKEDLTSIIENVFINNESNELWLKNKFDNLDKNTEYKKLLVNIIMDSVHDDEEIFYRILKFSAPEDYIYAQNLGFVRDCN